MHYIPGVSFDVSAVVRGATDPRTLAKNRVAGQFPNSGTWELYHIARRSNKVVYTFKSRDTGSTHAINFKNTSEGDSLISTLLGEDLPDYDDVYINMSD